MRFILVVTHKGPMNAGSWGQVGRSCCDRLDSGLSIVSNDRRRFFGLFACGSAFENLDLARNAQHIRGLVLNSPSRLCRLLAQPGPIIELRGAGHRPAPARQSDARQVFAPPTAKRMDCLIPEQHSRSLHPTLHRLHARCARALRARVACGCARSCNRAQLLSSSAVIASSTACRHLVATISFPRSFSEIHELR